MEPLTVLFGFTQGVLSSVVGGLLHDGVGKLSAKQREDMEAMRRSLTESKTPPERACELLSRRLRGNTKWCDSPASAQRLREGLFRDPLVQGRLTDWMLETDLEQRMDLRLDLAETLAPEVAGDIEHDRVFSELDKIFEVLEQVVLDDEDICRYRTEAYFRQLFENALPRLEGDLRTILEGQNELEGQHEVIIAGLGANRRAIEGLEKALARPRTERAGARPGRMDSGEQETPFPGGQGRTRITSCTAESLDSFINFEGWRCLVAGEAAPIKLDIVESNATDKDYYHPSRAYETLCEHLRAGRPYVLVTGDPKAGKTRMALEAIKQFPEALILFVKRPDEYLGDLLEGEIRLPRLPKGVDRAFLFYDDLEKYAPAQDPREWFKSLDSRNVTVIATVRRDPKHAQAQKKFKWAEAFFKKVDIELIDPEGAAKIANLSQVDVEVPEDFDGTIGHLLLAMSAKRQVFAEWPEQSWPRATLCACSLLRQCEIFEYDYEDTHDIAKHVFGTTDGSEATFEAGLHTLRGERFLLNAADGIEARESLTVYDSYLDQVVLPTMEEAMPAILARLIRHWRAVDKEDRIAHLASYHYVSEAERGVRLRALERCIDAEPDCALYHHLTAELLEWDDEQRARELEEREAAVHLEPENSRWASALGCRLMALERPEEAEPWLKTAHELEPTSERAKALADCYAAQPEREKEADALYREALQLDEDNHEARWEWVKLLCRMGRSGTACDEAVGLLESGGFSLQDGYFSSGSWADEIPDELAGKPEWRRAWMIFLVEESLNNAWWYLTSALDHLAKELELGRTTVDAVRNQLDQSWRKRATALPPIDDPIDCDDDGDDTNWLEGLRNWCGLFFEKESLRGLADTALNALRETHRQNPRSERAAASFLDGLGYALEHAAGEILELYDEGADVYRRFEESSDVREQWAWLQFSAAGHYGGLRDFSSMEQHLGELDKLIDEYQDELQLASVMAKAHYNAALYYGKDGKVERLESHIGDIEKVCRAHSDESGLRAEWAEALFNAALHCGNEGELERMDDHVESLKRLCRDHPDESELRVQWAKALANALIDYGNDGQLERVASHAEALERLCQEYPGESELRTPCAQALGNAILDYGSGGQLERVDDCLDALERLCQDHPDESQLRTHWAAALANAALVHCNDGRSARIDAHRVGLERLCQDYPQDSKLRTHWAETLCCCAWRHGVWGRFGQMAKDKARLRAVVSKDPDLLRLYETIADLNEILLRTCVAGEALDADFLEAQCEALVGAAEADGDHPAASWALNTASEGMLVNREFDEALERYTRAVQTADGYWTDRFGLAMALLGQSHMGEGRHEAEAALAKADYLGLATLEYYPKLIEYLWPETERPSEVSAVLEAVRGRLSEMGGEK